MAHPRKPGVPSATRARHSGRLACSHRRRRCLLLVQGHDSQQARQVACRQKRVVRGPCPRFSGPAFVGATTAPPPCAAAVGTRCRVCGVTHLWTGWPAACHPAAAQAHALVTTLSAPAPPHSPRLCTTAAPRPCQRVSSLVTSQGSGGGFPELATNAVANFFPLRFSDGRVVTYTHIATRALCGGRLASRATGQHQGPVAGDTQARLAHHPCSPHLLLRARAVGEHGTWE